MDFMQTRDVDYRCEQANLRGYLAWNDSAEPQPGILVFHEGLGFGDSAMERGRRLAGLGYVSLAAGTVCGRGVARTLREVATFGGGLPVAPAELLPRVRAVVATLVELPQDAARTLG